MKYDAQSFTLVENKEIAKGIFDWKVKNENLAKISLPGQFAHVSVPGKPLRRPISICDVQGDTLRLVFQVKGEGTEIMSRQTPGVEVDILAPLGNGFKIEKGKRYCFIGGGIGVPPMLYCAKQTENPLVITGFRNKDLVILQEDFKNAGAELYMTTDDGSAGIHGFVTDVLKEKINEADEICACGPLPMLRNVAKLAKNFNKPCYVSLEERMGCGVGACLVCACKVKRNQTEEYLHVCKDGPVFNSEEVVF